jgi:hypothetical protein
LKKGSPHKVAKERRGDGIVDPDRGSKKPLLLSIPQEPITLPIRVHSRLFAVQILRLFISAFCFLLFRFHHLSKSVGAARPRRPTVVGEVSRKMRDTASETLALPIEEAASSFSSPITHNSSSAQISVA